MTASVQLKKNLAVSLKGLDRRETASRKVTLTLNQASCGYLRPFVVGGRTLTEFCIKLNCGTINKGVCAY
jgi:hypothetical protein